MCDLVKRSACFLRWPGGKRWLAKGIRHFFDNLHPAPRYIEPFLGGGSVFFEVGPKRALLGDINRELINTYIQMKESPLELERHLSLIPVSKKRYLAVRSEIPPGELDKAARMLYLNRTCFNGIYRTNKSGLFNVPYGGGGRTPECILGKGIFQKASLALGDAILQCVDFSLLLKEAGPGDFVYCDPAYTVAHGDNGFIRYNESVFSWSDQERLRDDCVAAKERGAIVIVSNAAHDSLDRLYHPFKPLRLTRSSTISGSIGRGQRAEYLFLLTNGKRERLKLKESLLSSGVKMFS
jgi:DNA adenine methylase